MSVYSNLNGFAFDNEASNSPFPYYQLNNAIGTKSMAGNIGVNCVDLDIATTNQQSFMYQPDENLVNGLMINYIDSLNPIEFSSLPPPYLQYVTCLSNFLKEFGFGNRKLI